jgi:hypothetical protein
VNSDDFNILAGNFGQGPRNFTEGDFNYDTVVNSDDFNILAGNFGQVLPGLPSAMRAASERSRVFDEVFSTTSIA